MKPPNSQAADRARIDAQAKRQRETEAVKAIPLLQSMGYVVTPLSKD